MRYRRPPGGPNGSATKRLAVRPGWFKVSEGQGGATHVELAGLPPYGRFEPFVEDVHRRAGHRFARTVGGPPVGVDGRLGRAVHVLYDRAGQVHEAGPQLGRAGLPADDEDQRPDAVGEEATGLQFDEVCRRDVEVVEGVVPHPGQHLFRVPVLRDDVDFVAVEEPEQRTPGGVEGEGGGLRHPEAPPAGRLRGDPHQPRPVRGSAGWPASGLRRPHPSADPSSPRCR